jgi:uncharacterized protein (DUF2141 family)
MKMRSMVLVLAVLFSGGALAEGYTVAGQIKVTGSGVLLLELLSEEQFANGKNGDYGIAVAVSEEQAAATTVAFAFENVPAGDYVLQGFQDTNANNELDDGEPWAFHGYTPSLWSGPDFAESRIEVAADITDLVVIMND